MPWKNNKDGKKLGSLTPKENITPNSDFVILIIIVIEGWKGECAD